MSANVLIVDDIASNVKLLEAKLLGEYYLVFTANNGKDALNILENTKIDVVLLDVMMPDIDGFETCRRIKENPQTNHIPVIMVTALSGTEDRVKGLEAGADEFLTKPIDDTALFSRVKSLTRMKAVVDELKLRNTTNAKLGVSIVSLKDNFVSDKVLLFNDNPVEAKNISNILLNLTNQVKVIYNIAELENITNNYIPDLLIISSELEQSDPLRICVTLQANAKLRDIAIMLQAQEGDKSMILKALELGINDYFFYPMSMNELLARTKTQLRKKHYQDNLRNALELSVNLSIKDGLTDIFNRRYFDTYIEQMVNKVTSNKKPLCLLMCDIDYFKQVNDTYGHQAGDILLKAVANTLKKVFRVTDLIARFGGEEFVILLEDITIKDAIYIAEKVRREIGAINFKVDTQPEPIKKTISIGVTEYKIGETITSFVERADKALYQAKNTGRNKVINL